MMEFIMVRTRDSDKTGNVFICEHIINSVYRQYASCHEDEASEMIEALKAQRAADREATK